MSLIGDKEVDKSLKAERSFCRRDKSKVDNEQSNPKYPASQTQDGCDIEIEEEVVVVVEQYPCALQLLAHRELVNRSSSFVKITDDVIDASGIHSEFASPRTPTNEVEKQRPQVFATRAQLFRFKALQFGDKLQSTRFNKLTLIASVAAVTLTLD